MNPRAVSLRWFACLVALGWLIAVPAAQAKDLKLTVQLVWSTNQEKSPDPKHKPVSADLEKKLKDQPFKWQHYFEVSCKEVVVPVGGSQRVELSKDCVIIVKHLGGAEVEVTLLGKGEKVTKVKQKLPKGETLVQGGNAANSTGWFVVVQQAN